MLSTLPLFCQKIQKSLGLSNNYFSQLSLLCGQCGFLVPGKLTDLEKSHDLKNNALWVTDKPCHAFMQS